MNISNKRKAKYKRNLSLIDRLSKLQQLYDINQYRLQVAELKYKHQIEAILVTLWYRR